jgi:hypothetical protein
MNATVVPQSKMPFPEAVKPKCPQPEMRSTDHQDGSLDESNKGASGCAHLAPLSALAPELAESVSACSRRNNKELTRGELASACAVSTRTIYRWTKRFSLPFVQRNARVIRYPLDAVILLCACGIALNRENAISLGLLPDVIFAVAIKHKKSNQQGFTEAACIPPRCHSVLLAESNDDLRLIELWKHPERRETLRALVRMIAGV